MDHIEKPGSILVAIRSKRDIWIRSGFYLLSLSVFLMPFPRSWSLYPLGLSMIAGLMIWITDYTDLKAAFLNKFSFSLPLIGYFLLILIYFLFKNTKWQFLEGYLMFLLIPVFCFPVFQSEHFQKNKRIFIGFFISGLVIICLFELLRATFGWNMNSVSVAEISFDPESFSSPFRSQKLSFLEHPTYLSIKVLFAISLLILARTEINIPKSVLIVILLVLSLFLYLLSSRTSYLAFLFILILFLYRYLSRYRLQLLILVFAPLILFGAYKVFSLNPRVINKTELFRKRYTIDKLKVKDLDPRFTAWFTTVDLIKQHPLFGVGLDARNILADEYRKTGYNNEASLRLNSHNQFLETQLTLGIAGSLVLIWMFFGPLLRTRKLWKPELYYAFLIILVTTCLFESMLVRQWGIMFYTIFYSFQVNAGSDNTQYLL